MDSFSGYEAQRAMSILASLGLAGAGVAWLGIGLSMGYFYPYSLVLIVLGILNIARAALADD